MTESELAAIERRIRAAFAYAPPDQPPGAIWEGARALVAEIRTLRAALARYAGTVAPGLNDGGQLARETLKK